MTMDYNKVKSNVKQAEKMDEVEERPKMQAVVKKRPKKQKRGLMERLVIGLIGPDGVRSIGRKLNEDIVVPAIKNIVVDSITSGINMAIFGRDDRPRSGGYSQGNSYPGGYQNYGSHYKPKVTYGAPAQQQPTGFVSKNSLPEYALDNRDDALMVLSQLRDNITRYGTTSIADYYDLMGLDSNYTDMQYGWVNLDNVRVITRRGGYIIGFPPVELIG